jgi:conjugative transposon TraK protein
MFKKAKAIDSAFQLVRAFCLVVMVLSVLLAGFALHMSFRMMSKAESRIFILANGKILEAFAGERNDNIEVEARDHIKTFHKDFFSLDPDEKVITTNISKALYLADRSAKKQYDNLKESGYYTNLITANISQQIEVDSITINTKEYPYYFHCVAHEKLIRMTSIVTRNLITEGWLRNVARSDNNPHGFLIEKWMILENRDVKTENR